MFKWLLIIILLFLMFWTASRTSIPDSIRYSEVGRIIDYTLYPLQYKISDINRNKKFDKFIVQLDTDKFSRMLSYIDASNKKAVIYFYDTDSLVQRFTLNEINELSRKYTPSGVLFLVVSFEPRTDKLNFLISGYDKLYFRPLVVDPSLIKDAQVYYNKKDIKFSDTPVILYKSLKRNTYQNVSVGFDTKENLEEIIAKDK